MNTIHIIDFEGNKQLGVSEFGVVTLENFEITATHSRHCDSDGAKFNDYMEYFLSLRRSGILAAHSAHIEDGLLRHYWASPGKMPIFVSDETTLSWGPWIDTKLIYRQLFKDLASYELKDLISTFELYSNLLGIAEKYCASTSIGFHNALFDSLAAALLIQNLRRYFSNVSISILLSICKADDA